MSGVAQAMRLQSTIVSALVMRNMHSQHSKTRFGIVINILEPAAMVFTIFAMRFYMSGTGALYGIPLAVFVTTGYMPYHFHRLTTSDIMNATGRKAPSLMFPMVTSFDGVLAKVVNDFIIYGAAVVVACILVLYFFGGSPPREVLLAFVSIYLVLWYSAGLGMVVGVAARFFPVIRIIFGPVMRASLLISGGLYLATELPPQFLVYMSWNPLFSGIELMREAWIPGYVSPIASVSYMLLVCLGLSVAGMTLERRTRRFKFS